MRIYSLVLTIALVITGCGGGEDSPADKAFGGLDERDEALLAEWREDFRTVAEANVRTVRAFNTENVQAARRGVNNLNDAISDASQSSFDFDSSELRRVLQDYLAPFDHYGRTLDRFVSAWELETDTGVLTSDATVNALLADVQEAYEDVQRADQDLINRLLDVMSEEQRAELRAEIRRVQQQFEQQVAP